MEIGNRIVELRKKNGFSQEDLAEKVGVVRQTISKWELGETAPDLEQSRKLANVFNVSLEELVGNSKQVKKNKKKIFIIIGIIILFLLGAQVVYYFDWYSDNHPSHNEKAVDFWHAKCTLEDKTIEYYFKYYRSDNAIKSELIPASMTSIIGITEKDDAADKIFKVKEYYETNNGTCEIIEEDYEK